MDRLIDGARSFFDAIAPIAELAMLLGLPLVLLYLRSRQTDEPTSRRRRLAALRKKRCLGCGYDVQASDFRCPECGRVIVSEAAVMGYVPPDTQTAAANLEAMQAAAGPGRPESPR